MRGEREANKCKKGERRWGNYTRTRKRNHTRVTSVLIMDWKTVLLPSSMPPGLSPVGWYSRVESKNIIHSYMQRGSEKEGEGMGVWPPCKRLGKLIVRKRSKSFRVRKEDRVRREWEKERQDGKCKTRYSNRKTK